MSTPEVKQSKGLRRLAEIAARGRVLRRNFTSATGSFPVYVSPDSSLSILKNSEDAPHNELIHLAEAFAGQDKVVWDVGANLGMFSFASLQCGAKHVVSFEPDVWLCSVLNRTKSLPHYDQTRIDIISSAIGSEVGALRFRIAERGRAANALVTSSGSTQMGGTRMINTVPVLTLDSLADAVPAPDFIKIDVEGAEFHALSGGSELFNSKRPVVYCEVRHELFDDCKALFAKHDYKIMDKNGEWISERSDSQLDDMNYFFVPKENTEIVSVIKNFCSTSKV